MCWVRFVLIACAQIAGPSSGEPALRGVVVDSAGKPISGADVWLATGLSPTGEQPSIGGVLWMAGRGPSLAELQSTLARTRTTEGGEFRLELPAEIVGSQEPLSVAVWAIAAPGRVAVKRLAWAIPAPEEPIRLVIEKPGHAGFRLLGPDGTPLAGARVVPAAFAHVALPRELAEKVAVVAGDDGEVVLPAFGPGELRWVHVQSPKLGTQIIRTLGPETTGASEFRLEPVGRVSGHVVAGTDGPVSGVPVRAETFPDGYDFGGTLGSTSVTTDGNGQFEIPAIAAGRLSLVLELRSRPDLPLRGLLPANQVVEPGRTTTMEIRLKRAVHIDGVIRERGTGLPIAGVSPQIPDLAWRVGGNPRPVTDAKGRFEGYMEGDQPYAFLYTTPKPYYIPQTPDTFHLLPAGATEFKLPPTELVRGAALRGLVVDEAGKYVPGALVRASWGGDGRVLQSVAVRTDSNGRFLLDGLDPLVDLRLTAESVGRSSGTALSARAAPDKEVKIVVSRSNTVLISGRVLDSSGKPVTGALVRLRSQTRSSQGQVWRVDPVVFGDQTILHTANDGRFQAPSGLAASLEYDATITAPNASPGRTGWLKTGGGAAATFPDVVLERIRAVEGFVHDRDGRPVEGVTVFQTGDGPMRTRTVTDTRGAFRLPGVIAGKAILFARKDGFRFKGQPIDTEAGAADLTLARIDEAPPVLKTLDGALGHQEELALARRLLHPYIEKVMASGTDAQKFQMLVVLAQVDPARTLELLDTSSAGKPQFAVDTLRSTVATAMASQSPDEAVSIAESIQDEGSRTWCFTDVVGRLPASAGKRKTELLAQAQLQANNVKQPGMRIRLIARIAEHLLDMGDAQRAKALLEQGRSLAREVPAPAYEVAAFAPSLARIDLKGALALVENAKSLAKRGDRVNRVFVFDRAYGEIAYRVAASDPAGAEAALGLIVDSHRRGGYVVAACTRIVLKDRACARRLVETIEDPMIRAYGLGKLAHVLAAVDKPSASGLLAEAFDHLDQHRDGRQTYSSADHVAAVLLEVVEAVDPARLQEMVWYAISLRAHLLDERGDGPSGRSNAELAMIIARFDRAAAAAVLTRPIETFQKTDVDRVRQGFVAMAEALIDPARLVSLVESLPEELGLDRQLPKNSARLFAAEILAKQGKERWESVRNWGISIWKPEGSDL